VFITTYLNIKLITRSRDLHSRIKHHRQKTEGSHTYKKSSSYEQQSIAAIYRK
jgi:hypothetical protein